MAETLWGCTLLALALSMDTFAAGLALGTQQIKIPFCSALALGLTCSFSLWAAVWLGDVAGGWMSVRTASLLGGGVLVVMGSVRLCDGLLKNVLKKCCERENAWVFRIKNLRIFLQVCVDSTCADFNRSQSLSVSEAVSLAAALSVDGLAAGFGAGMMQQNHWLLLALSLGINLLAVKGGWWFGSRFCTQFERDISWSAGLLLILMGCSKWLR